MTKLDELAQDLAGALIEAIETTPADWSRPWRAAGAASYPHNVKTGNPYTRGNVFTLLMVANARGYKTGQWATFNQWNDMGCKIRKGQNKANGCGGVTLEKWLPLYKHPGEAKTKPKKCCEQCQPVMIPKTFTVFNAEQVEGEFSDAPNFPTDAPQFLPGAGEVRDYFDRVGADWREIPSDGAYYSPAGDFIVTPEAGQFDTVGGFASTVAHEFTHWTGNPARNDRDMSGKFGSESYALEELVAELGAVIVCNVLGLEHQPLETHGAYLASWLKALKSDDGPKLLWQVARQAGKAAEYITERATAPVALAA